MSAIFNVFLLVACVLCMVAANPIAPNSNIQFSIKECRAQKAEHYELQSQYDELDAQPASAFTTINIYTSPRFNYTYISDCSSLDAPT